MWTVDMPVVRQLILAMNAHDPLICIVLTDEKQKDDGSQAVRGNIHKQPQDSKVAVNSFKRQAEEDLDCVSDDAPRRDKKKRKKNSQSLAEAKESRSNAGASKIGGHWEAITSPIIEGELKRKKKAKKKRSRKNKQSEDVKISKAKGNDDDTTKAGEQCVSTTGFTGELEGCLTSDNEMVLIDRTNGKVYSGTERLANDDLKQIGTMDSQGKISLFDRNEMANHDSGEDTAMQNLSQSDTGT